jgi:hypothetical protein
MTTISDSAAKRSSRSRRRRVGALRAAGTEVKYSNTEGTDANLVHTDDTDASV